MNFSERSFPEKEDAIEAPWTAAWADPSSPTFRMSASGIDRFGNRRSASGPLAVETPRQLCTSNSAVRHFHETSQKLSLRLSTEAV